MHAYTPHPPQKGTSASELPSTHLKKALSHGLASSNGYTTRKMQAKGSDIILLIKGCGLTIFTTTGFHVLAMALVLSVCAK